MSAYNSLASCSYCSSLFTQAPQWLKQTSVLLLNYLRRSQIDALQISKYVESDGNVRATGNWQLSPYDQRLVSGYQRILRIRDHYINARLMISRRNSVAETPAMSLVSNVFDGLYPARCEVMRRGNRMSWRTFDKVYHHAISRLATQGGRVVLLQDIKKRLLVTEQRSRSYRITHIRLRYWWQRVLIVVNRTSHLPAPRVFFSGRFRRLPFKLYKCVACIFDHMFLSQAASSMSLTRLPYLCSRRRQVVLAVYRDSTARSRYSLTATMPIAGCMVRTNPAVSTEIRVSNHEP